MPNNTGTNMANYSKITEDTFPKNFEIMLTRGRSEVLLSAKRGLEKVLYTE